MAMEMMRTAMVRDLAVSGDEMLALRKVGGLWVEGRVGRRKKYLSLP